MPKSKLLLFCIGTCFFLLYLLAYLCAQNKTVLWLTLTIIAYDKYFFLL